MGITGTNILCSQKETSGLVNQLDTDYYFSRHSHVWGWATWRRAWQHYDVEIKAWPQLKDQRWLESKSKNCVEVSMLSQAFNNIQEGKSSTWDFQWLFSLLLHNGIHIIPHNNLVSNIGCGEESTHTGSEHPFANMAANGLHFPLRHPLSVHVNEQLDMGWSQLGFYKQKYSFMQRMKKSLKKRCNKIKKVFCGKGAVG